MSLQRLHEHIQGRVSEQSQKTTQSDLHHECRDLPPSRSIFDLVKAPTPKASGPVLSAPEGASPFSLEAAIFEEIGQVQLQDLPLPVAIDLGPAQRQMHKEDLLLSVLGPYLLRRFPLYCVWTEQLFSGGQPGDLKVVREGLDSIPPHHWEEEEPGVYGPLPSPQVGLLRMEPLIYPWQLFETRVLGGDGGVLFPEFLSNGQMEDLKGYADELGLHLWPIIAKGVEAERCVSFGFESVIVATGPAVLQKALKLKMLEALLHDLGEALKTIPHFLGAFKLEGIEQLAEAKSLDIPGALISGISVPHMDALR